MDRFAWGSIILALIIEGFLVFAGLTNPNEGDWSKILLASLFPAVLVGTVFLTYHLQRET